MDYQDYAELRAPDFGTHEQCKRVETKDPTGKPNGFLIELNKTGRRGNKTATYLTAAYPGCFKGYHAHRVRESNYVCIRGRIKVVLVTKYGVQEYILEETNPVRLNIPINIPTAIINESETDEAWLINCPDPAYDPALTFEQVDLATIEEATEWVKNNA